MPTPSTPNKSSHPSTPGDKLSAALLAALLSAGITQQTAAKSTQFVRDIHTYLQTNPEVWDLLKYRESMKDGYGVFKDFKRTEVLTRYAKQGASMNLKTAGAFAGKAAEAGARLRGSAAAFSLSAFVDLFQGYAKTHGIELNECAISVSKVSLDLAGGILAGPELAILSLSTGVSVIALGVDSLELGAACFPAN